MGERERGRESEREGESQRGKREGEEERKVEKDGKEEGERERKEREQEGGEVVTHGSRSDPGQHNVEQIHESEQKDIQLSSYRISLVVSDKEKP